jgi:hypothetical protein
MNFWCFRFLTLFFQLSRVADAAYSYLTAALADNETFYANVVKIKTSLALVPPLVSSNSTLIAILPGFSLFPSSFLPLFFLFPSSFLFLFLLSFHHLFPLI